MTDLVADARVVTLTGSGGCGKTRLAVEVAGDVASRFSDGACWVNLQGVSEPGLVAPTIGGAVGVHERPEQALTDTLVVVGVSATARAGHQPRAAGRRG